MLPLTSICSFNGGCRDSRSACCRLRQPPRQYARNMSEASSRLMTLLKLSISRLAQRGHNLHILDFALPGQQKANSDHITYINVHLAPTRSNSQSELDVRAQYRWRNVERPQFWFSLYSSYDEKFTQLLDEHGSTVGVTRRDTRDINILRSLRSCRDIGIL